MANLEPGVGKSDEEISNMCSYISDCEMHRRWQAYFDILRELGKENKNMKKRPRSPGKASGTPRGSESVATGSRSTPLEVSKRLCHDVRLIRLFQVVNVDF